MGCINGCPSEKVQHLLLGELLQWQRPAEEGTSWRRTSVGGAGLEEGRVKMQLCYYGELRPLTCLRIEIG